MGSDAATALPAERSIGRRAGQDRRSTGVYRWVEILSAVVLSLASIGTAWSGFQSSRWGGEQTGHTQRASTAIIRSAKFTDLAEQRQSLHVSIFGQWAGATSTGNTALATFLFDASPTPKAASVAWLATEPLTNPAALATPFNTRRSTSSPSARRPIAGRPSPRRRRGGRHRQRARDGRSDVHDRLRHGALLWRHQRGKFLAGW